MLFYCFACFTWITMVYWFFLLFFNMSEIFVFEFSLFDVLPLGSLVSSSLVAPTSTETSSEGAGTHGFIYVHQTYFMSRFWSLFFQDFSTESKPKIRSLKSAMFRFRRREVWRRPWSVWPDTMLQCSLLQISRSRTMSRQSGKHSKFFVCQCQCVLHRFIFVCSL